jgi:hypothetical protein
MGVGRLYLPWATSLSTIDGGYIARRIGRVTTLGVFAGSTPDPTSWSYVPGRQMGGGFINFEGGSYEATRYTSTMGVALTRIHWRPDRQFAFFENGIFYKRYLSIYHSMDADMLKNGNPATPTGTATTGTATSTASTGSRAAISRSYLTVRFQPHHSIAFDINHNYFRVLPTFDQRLISTGLVDNLLFQGLSGGVRVEVPYRITLYTSLGQSHRTGDSRNSWNQMYGVTFGRIPWARVRADLRYSKFTSSFGSGTYSAISLSREVGENLRIELQAGQQDFLSPLSVQTRARFVNSNVEWFLGRHMFLGSGFTFYRGEMQNYDQVFINLGYRF